MCGYPLLQQGHGKSHRNYKEVLQRGSLLYGAKKQKTRPVFDRVFVENTGFEPVASTLPV